MAQALPHGASEILSPMFPILGTYTFGVRIHVSEEFGVYTKKTKLLSVSCEMQHSFCDLVTLQHLIRLVHHVFCSNM